MNISTKGRYGLIAMLDLTGNYDGRPVTLNSIAKRQNISDGYLEQLMVHLKNSGLVKSVRGAQGGYILAKNPAEISVLDVLRSLEGPLAPVACVSEDFPDACGRFESCATRRVWEDVRNKMNEVLSSYSLTDLLAMESQCQALPSCVNQHEYKEMDEID